MRTGRRYPIANPSDACTVLGVGSIRCLFPVICALALALVPAKGAVLIHEYTLSGSLADNLSGPPLAAFGGQINSLGYVVTQSQGLRLTSPTLTAIDYSVAFSFRLSSAVGNMKLLDFHGLTDTTGLYQDNGRLTFIPGGAAVAADIKSGGDYQVVVTRDGVTALVSAYVNGLAVFSFTDTVGPVAVVANGELNFFRDNFNLSQADPAGGTINSIRVYNGALTAGEVSALYAATMPQAIPEPTTVALMVIGLSAAVLSARRRTRSSGSRHS